MPMSPQRRLEIHDSLLWRVPALPSLGHRRMKSASQTIGYYRSFGWAGGAGSARAAHREAEARATVS